MARGDERPLLEPIDLQRRWPDRFWTLGDAPNGILVRDKDDGRLWLYRYAGNPSLWECIDAAH